MATGELFLKFIKIEIMSVFYDVNIFIEDHHIIFNI